MDSFDDALDRPGFGLSPEGQEPAVDTLESRDALVDRKLQGHMERVVGHWLRTRAMIVRSTDAIAGVEPDSLHYAPLLRHIAEAGRILYAIERDIAYLALSVDGQCKHDEEVPHSGFRPVVFRVPDRWTVVVAPAPHEGRSRILIIRPIV